jgi:hypothetical protein
MMNSFLLFVVLVSGTSYQNLFNGVRSMGGLTFDMSGSDRLAGGCPLDGRVRSAGQRITADQFNFPLTLEQKYWPDTAFPLRVPK